MAYMPFRLVADPAPVVRVVRVPLEEFRQLQRSTRPEEEVDVFIPRSPCTVYQPDINASSEDGPISPEEFRIEGVVLRLEPVLHETLTAIWNYGSWEASYDAIRQRVYGEAEKTQFGNHITAKTLRTHVSKCRPSLRPLGYDIECDGKRRVMRRVPFRNSVG